MTDTWEDLKYPINNTNRLMNFFYRPTNCLRHADLFDIKYKEANVYTALCYSCEYQLNLFALL